jgi:hypothetical protein
MSSVPQGISPEHYSKKIRKWLQDLEIMDTNRIPKQALTYKPKGRGGIQNARRKDEGTNFTLRVKEQALRLTLPSSI